MENMTPEEVIEIRKMFCVSQEKFAQLLGSTTVTINRWENGKSSPSRLYIRELKQLRETHGSYVCRRKEFENAGRLCRDTGNGNADNKNTVKSTNTINKCGNSH